MITGSIDHIKAQGEILEGLVARIVSHESTKEMELVLKDYPLPVDEGWLAFCSILHISLVCIQWF